MRHLCTIALIGETEQITEYTIALDVLGKTEDFKDGKDSIVRVEVHRLRKRLAEFYEDEGASHRVRIVIPAGTYVPQFQVQDDRSAPLLHSDGHSGRHETMPALQPEGLPAQADPVPAPQAHTQGAPWWRRRPSRSWVATIGLLSVAVVSALELNSKDETAFDAFWNPVLSSTSQVLLCIGNQSGGHAHSAGEESAPLTLREFHSAQSQMLHVDDAITLARFAGMIQARGKRYRIVSQSEANYADLQSSPVVLIGLLNNDWTKRLVGSLRFTVERLGGGKVLIRDRTNPLRSDWLIDYSEPLLEISKDYALVLRATDPKTEQMVVAAAGMSIFGTLAAGEFLTNRNELRKLAAAAPKGWERKNLEIVLSTEVIRGHPGPPTVVATHFW